MRTLVKFDDDNRAIKYSADSFFCFSSNFKNGLGSDNLASVRKAQVWSVFFHPIKKQETSGSNGDGKLKELCKNLFRIKLYRKSFDLTLNGWVFSHSQNPNVPVACKVNYSKVAMLGISK